MGTIEKIEVPIRSKNAKVSNLNSYISISLLSSAKYCAATLSL